MQYKVRINKALFVFTVEIPEHVGNAWESGIQTSASVLGHLNEHFNIRWSIGDGIVTTPLNVENSCLLIAAFSTIPGATYHFTYVAQGSAYWLFHDITHVKMDVHRTLDGEFVAHRRMSKDEWEVLKRAARLAKRHGISQNEIEKEVERSLKL